MTRPSGAPPVEIAALTPDSWTEPFWVAAAEHRLVVPRCTSCGTYRMPPSPFCYACQAQGIEWVEQRGAGVVYSYTVIRHAVVPVMRDALPYVVAVVELPDAGGVRLVANLVDMDPDAVEIGMAVRVVWDDVDAGVAIPRFTKAG
ncbi:MAG TPA: Zn-ribbon domain-containing OB-fold protein [Acidimicrobiia bacterium]|jgi:hypothetical protein